jgi:hypothetical protein
MWSKIATIVVTMFILCGQALSQPLIKFINECPYNIYFWPVGPANRNL